jgi:hypothetical protein
MDEDHEDDHDSKAHKQRMHFSPPLALNSAKT